MVHPRVGGELLRICAWRRDTNGPSPRVRGTASTLRLTTRDERAIPACAGNTNVIDHTGRVLQEGTRLRMKNKRPPGMTPDDFKAWLKATGLKKYQAGELLGVSANAISEMSLGRVRIDMRTALACAAIAAGLGPWRPDASDTSA